MTDSVTLRTAHNRGNARVWLDRASCRTLGIAHGDAFTVAYHADRIRLSFPPDPSERRRRVAGSPDRPVIDITGRKVTAVLTSEAYTVTPCAGGYDIRPA